MRLYDHAVLYKNVYGAPVRVMSRQFARGSRTIPCCLLGSGAVRNPVKKFCMDEE